MVNDWFVRFLMVKIIGICVLIMVCVSIRMKIVFFVWVLLMSCVMVKGLKCF